MSDSKSKKVNICGVEIDSLYFHEALNAIRKVICAEKSSYIVTPNAAHIVMLQKDMEFKAAYKKASLVLVDGMSLLFAARLLGTPLKDKCSGSDLFEQVCRICAINNKKIFLLGGINGSERITEYKLRKIYPFIKISSYSPPIGFENNITETEKIIDMVNGVKTDVLIICVGAPKSEKWLLRNINRLKISLACPFGISLDFFVGIKKRAPLLLQRIGLEWFWRLIQEPRRLWKRYFVGNLIFIWLIVKEKLKKTIL